jgi:solute carrier family 25 iron transporter 28/37
MNIPFHSIHLIIYELLQDYLNYARAYDPLSHVISGAGAGAIASAITTPLDVCKTLLNTQECCLVSTGGPTCVIPGTSTTAAGVTRTASSALATEQAKGLLTAIRVIYVQGGMSAFFKGLTPRVLYQMPSTAVAWSCYEFFVSKIKMQSIKTNRFFFFRSIFLPANHRYYDLSDLFFKQVSDIFQLLFVFFFFSFVLCD